MIKINDLNYQKSMFQDLTEQDVKNVIGGATSSPLTSISGLISAQPQAQPQQLGFITSALQNAISALGEALKKSASK